MISFSIQLISRSRVSQDTAFFVHWLRRKCSLWTSETVMNGVERIKYESNQTHLVCNSEPCAWRLLSSAFRSKNEDIQFWWDNTGPLFALMLFEAGYSTNDQLHHLAFHFQFVVGALGPRPTEDGHPRRWRSYMTDDFSPIEFSWCWDGDRPKVRYAIEAISSESGTVEDPYNRKPALRLIEKLNKSFRNIDWTILEDCLDLFRLPVNAPPRDNSSSSPSTLGLAFEFGTDARLEAKAYLAPAKPASLSSDAYSEVQDFAEGLRCCPLEGAEMLSRFASTTTMGRSLEMIGVAVDCIAPEHSRVKVYARTREASVETARDILMLGNPNPPDYMEDVENLWHCLFSDDLVRTASEHETGGLLFLFDISVPKVAPSAKVYLPIRHYSKTDQNALEGLQRFLSIKEQRTPWLASYGRVVQGFVQNSGFRHGCQTYLSVGHKRGEISLTSYLSPQVFRR